MELGGAESPDAWVVSQLGEGSGLQWVRAGSLDTWALFPAQPGARQDSSSRELSVPLTSTSPGGIGPKWGPWQGQALLPAPCGWFRAASAIYSSGHQKLLPELEGTQVPPPALLPSPSRREPRCAGSLAPCTSAPKTTIPPPAMERTHGAPVTPQPPTAPGCTGPRARLLLPPHLGGRRVSPARPCQAWCRGS